MAITLRISVLAILAAWLSVCAAATDASVRWFSEDDTVLRVTGSLSRRVAGIEGLRGLAATNDGGAWAVSAQRLVRFAPDGNTAADLNLPREGHGRGVVLAVDPSDDSVWLATDLPLLLHVSAEGEVVNGASLAAIPDSITVAHDRSVWMTIDGKVEHRAGNGTAVPFSNDGITFATSVSVDAVREHLWVADAAGLKRSSFDGRTVRPIANDVIDAFAVDPKSGELWVVGDGKLSTITPEGDVRWIMPLGAENSAIATIQFDSVDEVATVRVSNRLLRVARDGGTTESSPLDKSLQMAASAPVRILPTVALVRPPAGGAIYERSRELMMRAGATCDDAPCVVPGYPATLTVEVDVNGIATNTANQDAQGMSTMTPHEPMRVGPNRVSMRVRDRLGNVVRTWATVTVLEPAQPAIDASDGAYVDKRLEEQPSTLKAANKAPAVTLTSPAAGASFTAGTTIPLAASASDPDGSISKVEFYRGGTTLVGTALAAPYQVAWQGAAAGTYALTAKAYDNRNGTATSAAVTITVVNNQAPVVSIASPAESAYFEPGSAVALAADATDADGNIARVEFYDRSTLIGTVSTQPFAFTWTSATAGRHSITARAIDNKGAASVSASVNIVVGQAPIVVVTVPVDCSTILGPITGLSLSADVMSTTGKIARVEFFDGGTLVGTAFSAPWTTLVDGTLGIHTVTARAIDDHGLASTSRPASFTVRGANHFPEVTLLSPSDGARFPLGSPVLMQATASDSDGTIVAVEFHSGDPNGPPLARVTTPPYTATVSNLPAGVVSILAVAIDDRDSRESSNVARITIAANAPPAIQLTAPVSGATYTAPAAIALAATASDSDGTVSQVQFYAGSTLIGAATSAPYALAWNGVVAGSYSITAKATDNAGAVAQSAPVSVTVVANAPPAVTLQAPNAGTQYFAPATIQLGASASDSDGAVVRVDFIANGTVVGSSTAAPYAFSWDGVPGGSYSIAAVATDDRGQSATSPPVVITVLGVPLLQFAAGLDGTTVGDDSILVHGVVNAPPNSAVTVNGVVTHIDDLGHFHANDVSLAPGANTITATVNSQDGQSTSQSIVINSTGRGAFVVDAAPVEGLNSLQVTFTVDASRSPSFKQVQFDLENDGFPNITATSDQFADGTLQVTATYPAGTWTAVITIIDDQDRVIYSSTKAIVVRQPATMRSNLRAIYDGMLSRLKAGNIPGALTAFTGSAYARYSAVFEQLRASLPSIVDRIGEIRESTMNLDLAEFAVVRSTPQGPRRFLIYLIRGEDGIWRIDGM